MLKATQLTNQLENENLVSFLLLFPSPTKQIKAIQKGKKRSVRALTMLHYVHILLYKNPCNFLPKSPYFQISPRSSKQHRNAHQSKFYKNFSFNILHSRTEVVRWRGDEIGGILGCEERKLEDDIGGRKRSDHVVRAPALLVRKTFFGCFTWSVTIREENPFQYLERERKDDVLKKILR